MPLYIQMANASRLFISMFVSRTAFRIAGLENIAENNSDEIKVQIIITQNDAHTCKTTPASSIQILILSVRFHF